MLATIIDTHAVWRIVAAAVIVGVGGTTLFGLGVRSLERLEARDPARARAAVVADGAVVALAGLFCVAAVVVGFVAMTHK